MIKEIIDKESFKQAAKLAEICFHEQTTEDNIKYYEKLKELYFIGIFENNELLATSGSYDFRIFVRNQLFTCSGICHVMTDPAHRRKGYVRKLMTKILLKNYKEDYEFTALWPFNHKFYNKFGYESCEKPIAYKFNPSDIKSNLKIQEGVKIIEVTDENQYPLLNQIAEKALNKYTRVVSNHDAWTLRGFVEGFKIHIFERENEPIGYISYKFKKSKVDEWQTNMEILDLVYIDKITKQSIFAYLRNFESDITNITLYLPYEEEVLSFLSEIKEQHKFASWPSMIRILNVKSVFEKMNFHENNNIELYAKIKDEIIEENNGIWQFRIQECKCSASKITEEQVKDQDILEIDIGKLSQIVVGFQSISKLYETEKKEIPKNWTNEKIFPIQPCMFGVWF